MSQTIKMTFCRTILAALMLTLTMITMSAKDFVVVIDPGHGGHDFGAVGKITNEKTINLAVAKKLGEKISGSMKDVKVVYTRETDKFIKLNERANIANRAKGDLFISIHVNSVDKRSRNRTTVAGSEVYTLGLHKTDENLAVAKRENAVMALESDYTETYKGFDPNSIESYIIFELSQSKHLDQSIEFAAETQKELTGTASRADKGIKQAGFWVLWATGMPSVLVELDFICNPNSEAFMASEAGQDKLAQALYNAFYTYKNGQPGHESKDNMIVVDNPVTPKDTQPVTATTESRSYDLGTDFRVQILASDKPLKAGSPRFKGLKDVEEYTDGGMHKYTVGHAATFEEAKKILRQVKTKIPEAFIIRMVDGKRQH